MTNELTSELNGELASELTSELNGELTKIFLIRHAEAEGNLYRRAHGQMEGLVTARGYRQIGLLRERFKDEKIDAVYSSDLIRARETAKAVSEPRGLNIQTTERLREVNMGVWEDQPWGELEYLEPRNHANFSSDPAGWIVSGAETFEEVIARLTDCIYDIARRHGGETVAIVTHGFAIRAFFCGLMGFPSHEAGKVLYCDNTAVALLDYEDGSMTIRYQSDNSHLNDENSTFAHQNWWRVEKVWRSENLRYLPLEEKRDSGMIRLFDREFGTRPASETEYAAFLANKAAGMVGISANAATQKGESAAGGETHCAAAQATEECEDDAGRIDFLYIKPEYRSMNLGVQLIGLAVSEFRRLGKEFLLVDAPPGNPAVKLCLKDGFEILEETDTLSRMRKRIRLK